MVNVKYRFVDGYGLRIGKVFVKEFFMWKYDYWWIIFIYVIFIYIYVFVYVNCKDLYVYVDY